MPETSSPTAPPDPFVRFGALLERARRTDLPEPTALALTTVGPEGRPSTRMVLLKGFDEHGFVFYTNLQSRKAREIGGNPWVALCFHWQPLEAQVRIEGRAEAVSDAEADDYFATRPRGSQIGAWSSLQSSPLPSRAELDARIRETEERFAGREVTRPPFWSGFRVVPDRIEFWSGRPSRLHDRDVYVRDPGSRGGWSVHHLYP
ncbi:MAG TPA: pyridoxamine 5'-phosphate oxidase [Longimicrobiaceae bacterium]|nr:pyridoxamine 5'-phosphate oxidase [Longimicrobiaceae bacterium]